MKSKEKLQNLIETIKEATGKTQGQISIGAGYKEKSLTQALSKEDGHEPVIKRLEIAYRDVLKKPTLNKVEAKGGKTIVQMPVSKENRDIDLQTALMDMIAITKEQVEVTRIQAETADKHAQARLAEADNNRRLIAMLERKQGAVTVDADPEKNPVLFARFEDLMVAIAASVTGKNQKDPKAVFDDMRTHFYDRIPKNEEEGIPVG